MLAAFCVSKARGSPLLRSLRQEPASSEAEGVGILTSCPLSGNEPFPSPCHSESTYDKSLGGRSTYIVHDCNPSDA